MSPISSPLELCLEMSLHLNGNWRLYANLPKDRACFVSLTRQEARKCNLLLRGFFILLWFFRMSSFLLWGMWHRKGSKKSKGYLHFFLLPQLISILSFSTHLDLEWILIVFRCPDLRLLCTGVAYDFSWTNSLSFVFCFLFF